MPYIKNGRRSELESCGGDFIRNAGELNYCITTECLEYIENIVKLERKANGDIGTPNYNLYNEVIGVLECVKQEFYRRVVAPYEDVKCKENGDVYE